MGMYNEAFAPCPTCNCLCEMHIPQVVLGFGGFYLDSPSNAIASLSLEEKQQLKKYIEESEFYCNAHGSFRVKIEIKPKELPIFYL